MIHLRPYQHAVEQGVLNAWQSGKRRALAVMPTGAGKTVLFSKISHDYRGNVINIAHRQELVSQISLALARNGVAHRIIAPDSVRRTIEQMHVGEFGRRYVDMNARAGVAGVDTLIRVKPTDINAAWLKQVGLWVTDEAHHVLVENKWGTACAMFPEAFGLGVTATPSRADGNGLGVHADGVFDVMVEGPSMRELIRMGYLTDYRVVAVPSDIDYSRIPIGESGELVMAELRKAVHESKRITGDVVGEYLRRAKGKLGVTFAVDIEHATELAAAYRDAGVPAEVVSSKTPDALRAAILRRFRAREVLQLVNVDLFGEGFDLPAIEVVSMVRRTESLSLYMQQFGRALRLMISPVLAAAWDTYTDEQRRAHIAASEKPRALIIDHVGNIERHLLPDVPRRWTLDRRERRSRSTPSDAIPIRACLGELGGVACANVYERVLPCCPFCGWKPEPASRSKPEHVDGDLAELDEATLAAMRGEVRKVDAGPVWSINAAPEVVGAIKRRHHERQQAQASLRETMALWGGYQTQLGRDVTDQQRRFFFRFGVDVLSAQALGRADAEALEAKVRDALAVDGVVNRG